MTAGEEIAIRRKRLRYRAWHRGTKEMDLILGPFADANVEKAADIAIAAKFATSGQDCLAANRIYVERPILEAFTAAFAARIARLKVGSGLEPGAEIGPLMHERAIAKVEEQVGDALKRGATLATGGKRHPAGRCSSSRRY